MDFDKWQLNRLSETSNFRKNESVDLSYVHSICFLNCISILLGNLLSLFKENPFLKCITIVKIYLLQGIWE